MESRWEMDVPDKSPMRDGLELKWEGPSLYEQRSSLDVRDVGGIAPGNGSKILRFVCQLGSREATGIVWLCTTLDKHGQEVLIVFKLFTPKLWPKPLVSCSPCSPYALDPTSHKLDPAFVWKDAPGPDNGLLPIEDLARDRPSDQLRIYRFTFPDDKDVVIAHVSEYVGDYNPQDLVGDLMRKGDVGKAHIHRLLEAIFEVYQRIHTQGVAHQDVGSRNIRVVWDEQRMTTPRVVIFDFDRVKFGRDIGHIFLTEQTTLNRFLAELDAWSGFQELIVTKWLEGEGKQSYESFAVELLTPEGLMWRAEENARNKKFQAARDARTKELQQKKVQAPEWGGGGLKAHHTSPSPWDICESDNGLNTDVSTRTIG